VIVDPRGKVVAGPLHEEYGILYADIDPAQSSSDHRTLDVAGHYGRPDVFTLNVDRSRRAPITFESSS
jgi:nitrilase